MNYKISIADPHKHFIDVEIQATEIKSDSTIIGISGWRPGRYELQNYARNIQKLAVLDKNGKELTYKKINRNQWSVATAGIDTIIIRYNCYCYQMDAGGVWLDENQLYLNLIYCLFYVSGKEEEKQRLTLNIPTNYKVGCGLQGKDKTLTATSYFQLIDSPLIASPNLISQKYEVNGTPFHIWLQGEVDTNWETILSDFEKFTKESIELFGEFPEKDYHFLFEILHYKNYHGVEHSNSTIIILGPAETFNSIPFYENLLGISCHELFHAWNALKIRPKEMMPYDLTKENYFRTGYVIEGLTTYYGDYLLARSGVFTVEQYFKELNGQFDKYFENFGRFNLSVADSSFDLWVDGYTAGIPNRKVSIYTSGAVAALLLDLKIRQQTKNKKCLDDVMRILWLEYGKPGIGYSEEDYQKAVERTIGIPIENYFADYINGVKSIEVDLRNALHYIGCDLTISNAHKIHEQQLGFHYVKREGKYIVTLIEPNSPADKYLTLDDEIVAINNKPIEGTFDELIERDIKNHFTIIRFGKAIERELQTDGNNYLNKYRIEKRNDANDSEKLNFSLWLKMNH